MNLELKEEIKIIDERCNQTLLKEKSLYLRNRFIENGYIVYQNLLTDEETNLLFEYTKLKRDAVKWFDKYCVGDYPYSHTKPVDTNIYFGLLGEPPFNKDAFTLYADIFSEILLKKYKKIFQEISNQKLFEVASFLRFYVEGDDLKKHRDRGELGVSGTIHIGGNEWDIKIQDLSGKEKIIKLNQGDCLIYQGHNCVHWRETLKEKECLQMFLHYTPTKNKHFKYDRRDSLGLPPRQPTEADMELKEKIGMGGYT